ncbi:MAG: hypothetical protein UIH27_00240, partial [Ruminococcus sp.]|nr:hypothetical protein [Ruminococcus sp.]
VYQDEMEYCTSCRSRKPLLPLTDSSTPVYLTSADGFERERIQTALTDNGIPNDSVIVEEDIMPASVKGYSSSWRDILVPYSAYDKAYDICVGIGAVKLEGEEKIIDEEPPAEEFEDMPPAKRTTVKILSAILFIIVAALIIFGTDAITGFIKGLFH